MSPFGRNDGGVELISTDTLSPVKDINVENIDSGDFFPYDEVCTSNYLYILKYASDGSIDVIVVNISTGEVEKTLNIDKTTFSYNYTLYLSPDGKYVYVEKEGNAYRGITVISTANNSIVKNMLNGYSVRDLSTPNDSLGFFVGTTSNSNSDTIFKFSPF